MAFAITSDSSQMVPVTASPTSASGAAATVDGALRITIVSGDGTFTQDPATPMAVNFVSGAAAGDTVYTVEADADLGAGTTLISDTVTYSVTLAVPPVPQASAVGLVAGAAVPKV